MKLVVAIIEGNAATAVIAGLRARGYAVLPISDEGDGAGSVSVFIPVQTAVLPQLLVLLAEWGRFETDSVNPLLPLSDPGEYYVANPVPAGSGGSALYVMNLQRYERIG